MSNYACFYIFVYLFVDLHTQSSASLAPGLWHQHSLKLSWSLLDVPSLLAVLTPALIDQGYAISTGAAAFAQNSVWTLLWRGWYGTLKTVVWYFEEGCVVLWRGLCGILKRVVWYFEEGGVVLWRGLCGTLNSVVWYSEEGGMVLWRGWYGTLKRVVWYFEEGCVVL